MDRAVFARRLDIRARETCLTRCDGVPALFEPIGGFCLISLFCFKLGFNGYIRGVASPLRRKDVELDLSIG
jgi:hypothetical protein